MHTHTHARHTHAHTYTCTHIHMHTYTHAHTHSHTPHTHHPNIHTNVFWVVKDVFFSKFVVSVNMKMEKNAVNVTTFGMRCVMFNGFMLNR